MADIGIDLEAKGTVVTDHVDFVKSSSDGHSLIASEEFVQSEAVLGNFTDRSPILFKGTAASISPESTLVSAISAQCTFIAAEKSVPMVTQALAGCAGHQHSGRPRDGLQLSPWEGSY